MSAHRISRSSRNIALKLMAILSIFIVATRRLWSTRWLALASAVGLVVVVSLTLSVPIYADAVYHRILQEDMAAWGDARRPPFAFMYRYVGDMSNPAEWSEVAAADQMMQAQLPAMLGLPRQMLVRYFATAAYPVFASGDAYESQRQALTRSPFGMMNDLTDHITLMDGAFPGDMAGGALDEAMPVLVSKLLANKLGWQVGERYLAFDEFSAQHEATQAASQIPIVVSGIWEPRDDTEFYWYSNPDALQSILFTTEGNFMRRLAPQLKGEQYLVVWYMLFDGSGVRSGDVPGLLERMGTALTRAAGVLPNVRLDHSPAEALKRYERTSNLLMVQLFAFSVPILVLTFVFIALVAGLTVNNQHNEIAVLRSRGASVTQILGIALLEAMVLGALALGASAPAGERIAQLVGQTRSFMDFVGVGVNAPSLPTAITLDSLRTGLITVGLAVLITVTPTLGAAGYTVVTYKQQRARALRPPWWQRIWLDVLIFIPAAYGTYLLQKQGVVA
ncbi:MAG: hypothetical protein M1546_22815, partial [Chloroflexi bacterium]|nr:hypothetical protein [Chloroflexota bacterium]